MYLNVTVMTFAGMFTTLHSIWTVMTWSPSALMDPVITPPRVMLIPAGPLTFVQIKAIGGTNPIEEEIVSSVAWIGVFLLKLIVVSSAWMIVVGFLLM